jgi:hypothetical protein
MHNVGGGPVMNMKLLNGASMTGLLTLITTGAGVAGTIVTPDTGAKLAIAGLVATCGMLAMLKGYNDCRDVAYTKGALQALLATLPGSAALQSELTKAVKHVAIRRGYMLHQVRILPNGEFCILHLVAGTRPVSRRRIPYPDVSTWSERLHQVRPVRGN